MTSVTIGMDLGDKKNQVCVLSVAGKILQEVSIPNTAKSLQKFFRKYPGATAVMETGTHSPWVSRELESLGCRVLVGNARKLRAIWASPRKSDVRDAEMLARIGRFDPQLLSPIQHRDKPAQVALEEIKARDVLVQNRSTLVNHVRSVVKSIGGRIPKCSTPSFAKRAHEHLPPEWLKTLAPMLKMMESLTDMIRGYDKRIEELQKQEYPEAHILRQVTGVGPITALAFVLTLEEVDRFKKSRTVGAYLGLTPKRDQSGESDKSLRISKQGNKYLRQLLVNCAHYILGPFGPDCDLRRYGERIAQRGGKRAKRQAVVAVARKLAVLLHRLWSTGEEYQEFYRQSPRQKAA